MTEEESPEIDEADVPFHPFMIEITKEMREQLSKYPLIKEYLKIIEVDGYPFVDEPAHLEERVEALEGLVIYMSCILHDKFIGVENFGAEPPPEKPLPKELIV